MASVQKFTRSAVVNQLRHIERTIANPSNKDIDRSKMDSNYILSPDRGVSNYDYFKQRIEDVYVYNRSDVNVMAGWVVTAPRSLASELQESFFKSTYEFLSNRYGEDNVVSCVVHKDEIQPHMHFVFIPVTYDKKRHREKVCANEVLNKKELRNFHGDLKKHLTADGIDADILTGVTKRQGRNMTVKELKQHVTVEYREWNYTADISNDRGKRVW